MDYVIQNILLPPPLPFIQTDDEEDDDSSKVFCGAPRCVMTYALAAMFSMLAYSLSY